MEGRGGAAWLGTWISLFSCAAWLTLVTGQRNTALEQRIEVRLLGGAHPAKDGIVELTYNGQRGKLCNIGITEDDAAILCRMLGYAANGDQNYRLLTLEQQLALYPQFSSSLPYILYGLECNKLTDNSIADCNFESNVRWFNAQQCVARTNDVGIQCFGDRFGQPTLPPVPTPAPTIPPRPSIIPTLPGCTSPSPNVRLAGSDNSHEGRVEVRRTDGSFGAICDNEWDRRDAQVICRMLCYDPQYSEAPLQSYGQTGSSYYLTDVGCTGREDDILSCSSKIAEPGECSQTEPATVTCFDDVAATDAPPSPIMECTNDNIIAKFSRELEPQLRSEHLSLLTTIQPDCGYNRIEDANFISIRIPYVGCETVKIANGTHITYRNTIRHSIPTISGIITRSTTYLIEVTCVQSRDSFPERNLEPQGQPAPPASGTGEFNVDLELFRSSEFTSPIRVFPARVTLGEMMYVGLTLRTTDQSLKLIVPSCIATADVDRQSQPSYILIENKCRIESTLVFYAFNDTFFAFRFQTFKFVGDRPFIYIHCTSFVCGEDDPDLDCDRSCDTDEDRGKRSVDFTIQVNMGTDNTTRRKRAVTRSLFPSDRGPIEFLDASGNLIQLDKELEKPRPILTASGSSNLPSACVKLIALVYMSYHLLQ